MNRLRDLQKVYDVVKTVEAHLNAKDEMNAALHMTPESVRPTPLAAAVRGARSDLERMMLEETGEQ